jgi:hypothetical protein
MSGRLSSLAQPNSWAAAILVNEFHARGFKSPADGQVICRRHRFRIAGAFGATDCVDSDGSGSS